MRILGIDPGSRRIGVALSDELGLTAQPLTTIERGHDHQTLERLDQALGHLRPDRVVVGLPLRLDGTEGGAARRARELARLLETHLGVPAELWDERLTSVQADRILRQGGLDGRARRGATDRVAAAIMLQSYLDARSREPGAGGEGLTT